MSETSTTEATLWNFAFRLVSSDWATLILQVWQLLTQIFAERTVGPYEVLNWEYELELFDAEGKKAVYRKYEDIRVLQDYMMAYYDQAWGDGELFADYKCSPGVAVDRYRDGYKYQVLISLRQVKRRGDIMHINIERTVRDGFTQKLESSETDINHRMERLSLVIIFPKTRHCKRVSLIEKNASHETPLSLTQAEILPDGRQRVSWETKKPRLFETYRLKWEW